MKYLITAILLVLNYLLAFGQDSRVRIFLQTKSKTQLYYVDLKNTSALAYEMGNYFDKAGTGYIVKQTDTLIRQIDGAYLGKHTKIILEDNKHYLVIEFKKTKKLHIDTVKTLNVVNNKLNNAYYLDHYFRMSDELNKSYPLNHHTFRNGFYTWEGRQNKEIDYLQFREFASIWLKEIKDSISRLQDSRVALTDYLIQNVRTVDYNTLKDSLTKLPAEYKSLSWYYGRVINEVAKQRPEYFFRIAEDFSSNRSLIFSAVDDNREVIQGLRTVEGHNEIKKEFLEDKIWKDIALPNYRNLCNYWGTLDLVNCKSKIIH